MLLMELFMQIEGIDFESNLRILSGFEHMLLVLQENNILGELIETLRDNPGNAEEVYERILTLLPENEEPEYAHPHDAALAGYVYVLSQTDMALAQRAIEAILSTPQLWWAARLARHLQANAVLQPGAKD